MKHIDFVCLCSKGRLRQKNQDNFWVNGKFLPLRNEGLQEAFCGSIPINNNPLFTVFDGMGGMSDGEVAAYISAKILNDFVCENGIKSENDLDKVCLHMNNSICMHMKENSINEMGSTVAMILFKDNKYTVCNIGDSPIFKFSNKRLNKISTDHVASENYSMKKPGLTQYLGVPNDEFLIEPYLKTDEFNIGDCFLLCSDGMVDMVSNFEISTILETNDIKTSAQKLMNSALENGGIDNITIVLCEVKEGKTNG